MQQLVGYGFYRASLVPFCAKAQEKQVRPTELTLRTKSADMAAVRTMISGVA
jgi:hypothetical protein